MSGLLVSGAGGYVGARVIEAAAQLEGRAVHALWRRRSPPASATAHQLDLVDTAALRAVLTRTRPDVVLHAAYEMGAGAEPNLRWSRNLLAASHEVGARFVFLSTDLVFDGLRGWYREDDPPNATLPYGVWKAQLEREVLAIGGVVARTALVWGLEPLADSVESLVLGPLRRGEVPRLFADECRTPTEVHDLASALLEACDIAGPRVLHLAGPERLTRLELGRMLARHFGFDPAAIPPSLRAEIAPERPPDTSLLVEQTRDAIATRFRGPSELLKDRGDIGPSRSR